MSATLPKMTHKSRRENSGLRFQIKMQNTEKTRRARKKLIAYSCLAPPNLLQSTHFFLEFFFVLHSEGIKLTRSSVCIMVIVDARLETKIKLGLLYFHFR